MLSFLTTVTFWCHCAFCRHISTCVNFLCLFSLLCRSTESINSNQMFHNNYCSVYILFTFAHSYYTTTFFLITFFFETIFHSSACCIQLHDQLHSCMLKELAQWTWFSHRTMNLIRILCCMQAPIVKNQSFKPFVSHLVLLDLFIHNNQMQQKKF